MKKNNKIFFKHLGKQYEKEATSPRKKIKKALHELKLGMMLRQARKEANITQQEVAQRANTKRSYISRIERDCSDMRLSTLIRVIEKGLNGKLILEILVFKEQPNYPTRDIEK
ncbi:MAG: helix-turn-helix domain-containing protein [Cytophagales bacterium]|nr:helix-turn-helix domain-containing protein [Cytophagales bacterium]